MPRQRHCFLRLGACCAEIAAVCAASARLEPAMVSLGATRPAGMLGAGNELCWQSLADEDLQNLTATSLHGWIGRFPGGTPSNYFDWRTGTATDCPFVAAGTAERWARWTKATGITDTIFVANVLTDTLPQAVAALKAQRDQGQRVRLVELGNELYDTTDPNYLAKYRTPRDYADAMQAWTVEIKREFPEAKVALIGERWNAWLAADREQVWNKEVLQAPSSQQADAATIHVYAGPMPAALPRPEDFPAFLRGALAYIEGNRRNVDAQIPGHLRVWVTELGVWPPFGPTDGTWLQALYHATLTLGLFGIDRVDIVLPYCLVCQDPTGPSLAFSGGGWKITNKGLALSLAFDALRGATEMTALGANTSAAVAGWRTVTPGGEERVLLLNTGNAGLGLELGGPHLSLGAASYTQLAPRSLEDMLRPSARPERLDGTLGEVLQVPAYSITLLRGAVAARRMEV